MVRRIPGKGSGSRRSPERKLLDALALEGMLFTMVVEFYPMFSTFFLNLHNEQLHSYIYTLKYY
jgi:hypothetical protein